MKITWFGKTAFRVHAGGAILVVDPNEAPESVDRRELASGADAVLHLGTTTREAGERFDPQAWRPRRPSRLIDEDHLPERKPRTLHVAKGALLIESNGEALLVADADRAPAIAWGRWADDLVVVLAGKADACLQAALAAVAAGRPRLLALALPETDVEVVLGQLAGTLGGASAQVLEPGLAVEV